MRVEPLRHFPIVKDLVIDMNDFLAKLTRGEAVDRAQGQDFQPEREYIQSPEQLDTFKQFSTCINCMLCYAACPVYGLDPHFTGPAAIALAERYNLDSRDQGTEERLDILSQHDGIWDCTVIGECSEVCPKERRPFARDSAIQAHRHQGMVQVIPDAVGRQVT